MLVKDFITKDTSSLNDYSKDSFFASAPSVLQEDSVLNALVLMAEGGLEYIKVADHDGSVVAVLNRKDIINIMDKISCMDKPGSIIIVEMDNRDFSLSEIARIAESNNARIETLLTRYIPLSERMQLLIRINTEDATAVIRSLERFNYNVVFYSMKEGAVNDSLQQRVDELIRCFTL